MRSRTSRLLVTAAVAAMALPAVAAAAPSPAPLPTSVPTPSVGAVAEVADAPRATGYLPGEPVAVSGTIGTVDADALEVVGAPTTFSVVVETPAGERRGPFGPVTSAADGTFAVDLPAAATEGLPAGTHAVRAVGISGAAAEDEVTLAPLQVAESAAGLGLEASFVSSTGWVKPGDTYPFRVFVTNTADAPRTDLTVAVAVPAATTFTDAVVLGDAGDARILGDGSISWTVDEVPAATQAGPGRSTLVVEAVADSLGEDPEVVWKDLSATATLTDGGEELVSTTHGPKVIPPAGGFETARYGDKPFAIVQVDFSDRKHEEEHTGQSLEEVVNDPAFEGSTFNLYQEMSYGQLFPEGLIPAKDLATADFEYEPGFDFTTRPVTEQNTCRGFTFADTPQAFGTPLYPERVVDGWYQLPGDTEYYGGDYPAFDLGTASSIDSACGQTGKAVYDAATIADPEIDYDEFDSDKDGVVDFFMMLFVGCGGNGGSQLAPAPDTPATNELCSLDSVPYDNIWPHSSSLEMQYKDEETGLRGYVSDDQLTSLEGVPQCWLDDRYLASDDCASHGGDGRDDLPVFVRVGPYNVNPETSFDAASVISHEYGHHLGLPDFYNGSAEYYGSFNLMAADFGQHMTVFGKQDLGWIVPEVLQPGESRSVEDWREVKSDTGEIRWETPDGAPYTLSAANGDQNIHNGEAYTAKLPSRILIDPEKVAEQASGEHVWYSGRGNDFGCSPTGGHNLDLYLPELRDVPEGAEVKLAFASSWDIEWDWDYGFVLTSGDGATYTSVPSENGYTTTSTYNPNGQQCLDELDNGITGQSGAYEQGEPFVTVARNPAAPDYATGSPFLADSYDISALAGADSPVVRFSYFTDAAFDRPGWFIDDLEVTVDGETVYSSDAEADDEQGRLFPGGCDPDGFDVAVSCTAGWSRISASAGSPADHAYYLELRDRALFDFEGYGQSDRGLPNWEPGLLIEYTDEAHGYGNNGVPAPPAQMYLDSQPVPGEDCGGRSPAPNCDDMSFTPAEDDDVFTDVDFVNSFADDASEDGFWHFDNGCLSATVRGMSGQDTIQLQPDLTADIDLTAGEGCARFSYLADGANAAPDARATAKPSRAQVGQTVSFDGSGSTDDLAAPEDLRYRWDLGDGTTVEGQSVQHAYDAAGTYTVTLTVTDPQGESATDTVTVEVVASDTPAAAPTPLPATGGGAAGLAALLLGAGLVTDRLRRRS